MNHGLQTRAKYSKVSPATSADIQSGVNSREIETELCSYILETSQHTLNNQQWFGNPFSFAVQKYPECHQNMSKQNDGIHTEPDWDG